MSAMSSVSTCEVDHTHPRARDYAAWCTCTPATPVLPYADGCQHASACGNVYAGRACALDASKRNGYTSDGRATVTYLADDTARGVAAGSVVLAVDPYTGRLSGRRY